MEWLEKYIFPALGGALTGAGAWVIKVLWGRQKRQAAQQEAIKAGMLALLHDRIYAECAGAEERGCVTVDGLRNLEYLYGPYHSLGGNGTGTVLYERYKKLPVKPATEESA
jgi:hypothetical protein